MDLRGLWAKGLTKETDVRIAKRAKTLSMTMKKMYAEGIRHPPPRRESKLLQILHCKTCGKEFTAWPSEIRKRRKYCSLKCRPAPNKGVGIIKPNLTLNENLTYIIGVLKGDGYCFRCSGNGNARVGLAVKDLSFAESFYRALKQIGLNPRLSGLDNKGLFVVEACSLEFLKWYRSLSLQQIEKIISTDKRFLVAFVKGFYESEGSNSRWSRGWHVSVSNKNLELLSMIQRLLRQFDFDFRISGNQETCYKLRSSHASQNIRFLEVISPCIRGLKTSSMF